MAVRKPLTIDQRVRRLRKPRSLLLRHSIDLAVFEHIEKMVKRSEKNLKSFRIVARYRAGYLAALYNRVVFEQISTQEDMDAWFLQQLRERAGNAEQAK